MALQMLLCGPSRGAATRASREGHRVAVVGSEEAVSVLRSKQKSTRSGRPIRKLAQHAPAPGKRWYQRLKDKR